jgi:hypothetical protein
MTNVTTATTKVIVLIIIKEFNMEWLPEVEDVLVEEYLDFNACVRLEVSGRKSTGYAYIIGVKTVNGSGEYYAVIKNSSTDYPTIDSAKEDALFYTNVMNKAFGCGKCKK